MDLRHSGALDGLCIVSNDSDYTRLALSRREQRSGALVHRGKMTKLADGRAALLNDVLFVLTD
jgi:hypothetical protein